MDKGKEHRRFAVNLAANIADLLQGALADGENVHYSPETTVVLVESKDLRTFIVQVL